MRRKYMSLTHINNDHPITKYTDPAFYYELQQALLLALLEQENLTQMQYRWASENLKLQRQEDVRKMRRDYP